MKLSPLLSMTVALSLFSITAALALPELKTPPSSGHSLGSVTGGRFGKAQMVIESKCIACHKANVIEEAIAAGKNMQEIQKRMEQKGVKLSGDDRTVLGVFWRETPLKKRQ